MALVESVGVAFTGNNTTTAATTASFTPTAGNLICLIATVGNGNSATGTALTVSGTGFFSGASWTRLVQLIPVSLQGGGGVWVLDAGGSPSAGTVTVTTTGGPTGVGLIVRQFANAAPQASQTGVTATKPSGTFATIPITPLTTGSQTVGGYGTEGGVFSPVALASTSIYAFGQDATNGDTFFPFEASSLSTGGTLQTLGITVSNAGVGMFAAEILPGSGGGGGSPAYQLQQRRAEYRHGHAQGARRQQLQLVFPNVLQVTAGLATATGAALDTTEGMTAGLTPGLATGIGSPLDGSEGMAVGLAPGLSSGTGAAQAVGGGLTSGLATGAGAVPFAGSGLTPGLATGTGAAKAPGIGLTAGLATATGAALAPAIGLTPALATGTGAAQSVQGAFASIAGLASGTGAANAPNLGFTPGLSSGTGAAQAVGGGLTSGLSTGTGAAQFAGSALTPGLSTGTGAAQAPSSALTPGLSTGTGAANTPGTGLTPALATGTGAAQTAQSGISSTAGLATGTGAANTPGTGLTPGLSTGTGAALDFNQGMGTGLTPGLATGTGAALDAVAQGPVFVAAPTLTTKNYTQVRHHHGMWRQQIQQVFPANYTVTAGLATASGAALDFNQGMGTGLTLGLATGTGAANTPGTGLTTGLATGTGAAQTPGSGRTSGLASGTGAAQAAGGGRTTGLASGAGTAQFAGTGLTPAIATGTGAALAPFASSGGRANVDYTGSTLVNPNTLGGTVSIAALGGTLSVGANTLGGSVTVVNTLGGTVSVATLGGTAAVTSDTLTGTLSVVANTLSGTAKEDKMQEVDIVLNEFNDATVTFQILNNGSPDNITGMTINALFKKTRGDLDSAGTTVHYSSGGGSPAITIVTPTTGSCTLAIPDADVIFPNWTFYRIDVVNGSVTTTAIFGTVTITQL